jgi:hypothetical protein
MKIEFVGYFFVVIVGIFVVITFFQMGRSYFRWKKKHSANKAADLVDKSQVVDEPQKKKSK